MEHQPRLMPPAPNIAERPKHPRPDLSAGHCLIGLWVGGASLISGLVFTTPRMMWIGGVLLLLAGVGLAAVRWRRQTDEITIPPIRTIRRAIRASGQTAWRQIDQRDTDYIDRVFDGESPTWLHARLARHLGIEGQFEIEIQYFKDGVWLPHRSVSGNTAVLPED